MNLIEQGKGQGTKAASPSSQSSYLAGDCIQKSQDKHKQYAPSALALAEAEADAPKPRLRRAPECCECAEAESARARTSGAASRSFVAGEGDNDRFSERTERRSASFVLRGGGESDKRQMEAQFLCNADRVTQLSAVNSTEIRTTKLSYLILG